MIENLSALSSLVGSEVRPEILSSLYDSEKSLGELREDIGCPRSTLKRNLSLLTEAGWTSEDGGVYTTTLEGKLFLDELRDFDEDISRIQRFRSFLDSVDTPCQIDVTQVRDAQVVVPTSEQPYRPLNHLFERLKEGDISRIATPVASQRLIEWTVDQQGQVEYVLHEEKARLVVSRVESSAEAATASDSLDVYCTSDVLPYGVFVGPECVLFAAYDDQGRVDAVIDSSSDITVAWGSDRYEDIREGSTSVSERSKLQSVN